ALTREIEAAVDGVDVERTLRDHAKAVLAHIDLDGIEARVEATVESVSARAEAAIENAIDRVEAELADWFDSAMDRVTGWYVRRAKTMLFLIGFGLAATLNFDLIGYGKQLAADDALRSAMVQQAQASAATGQIDGFAVPDASAAGTPQEQNEGETENVVDANGDGEITDAEAQKAAADLRAAIGQLSDTGRAAIATVTAEFAEKGVTLGASFIDADWATRGRMFLSWLLIGLGCTLGGQFWFDFLKTFLKVRAGASGLNSDAERLTRA
ncbi:MAG: hypothetical protein AAF409_20850, partial [Pseudomonadota bacterium]